MNDGLKEFVIAVMIIIVGLLVFVGILGTGVYYMNSARCKARWEQSYEVQYGFWTKCLVKVNDKWLPERNVREIMD